MKFTQSFAQPAAADAAANTPAARAEVLVQVPRDAFLDACASSPVPFETWLATWLETVDDPGRLAQARHAAGLAGRLPLRRARH